MTGVFSRKGDDLESVDAEGNATDAVESTDPVADPS
jgi:hypothetical protein